jgi:hypothetical protein
MSYIHNTPGAAPEIAQARVRQQLAESGAELPSGADGSDQDQSSGLPNPPEAPTSPGGAETVLRSITVNPPQVPQIDVNKSLETNRLPLASLPNEDLVSLLRTNGLDPSTFESREAVIAALTEKGIDSIQAS